MNKLTAEQRAAILTALVEGNSIASTCRMLGVNKITVLRLLADAGTLAQDYHELTVCDLSTKRVQMDEIWSYVGCKQIKASLRGLGGPHKGDAWTWVSIDADSKLAINWNVGGRDATTGLEFVTNLASRLADRVQLTSDAFAVYRDAVKKAFKGDVDYAQLVKDYKAPVAGGQVRVPPVCVGCRRVLETGSPDVKHISTSFVERQNLTMRMSMRRFTRLTNAFSKRLENHKYAVVLYFFHYNFIRIHQTIKTTPAIMAGVADKQWTMLDFVNLLVREEQLLGGRLSDYKKSRQLGN